ncbi:hypothetical protein FGIG_07140, partial [Fasciola gigantica]
VSCPSVLVKISKSYPNKIQSNLLDILQVSCFTSITVVKFPYTHLSDESSVEPSIILENLSTDLISKNSATPVPSQNPWNTRTKTSASNLDLRTVAMHSRDTRLGNKENIIPAEIKYTFRGENESPTRAITIAISARSKRENSENKVSLQLHWYFFFISGELTWLWIPYIDVHS